MRCGVVYVSESVMVHCTNALIDAHNVESLCVKKYSIL